MKSKSNSKAQPVFDVTNSKASDWIDKQELMQKFHLSSRTLQYYRSKNLIPFAKLGGKVFYHLPGFLQALERSASHLGNSKSHLISFFFFFLFS